MNRRDGFTLIELMIVVVIVGILAAIAVPRFSAMSRRAKEAEAKPMLREIVTLQERYRARDGTYTTDILELEGGAALAAGGKFYGYSIAAHASGYCVVATPSAVGTAAGLTPVSLDAARNFYDSGSCS
jgi:prepilin-type N-terminal cleavage/methylation domain-containing protein